MTTATLSMWGNGAVTLPKKWREQFPTKHFIAKETADGLLIKPILDVEYYENDDGSFGLRFPNGINAGELSAIVSKINADLAEEERKENKRKGHPPRRRG